MNTKLTILYERLSREDERENESISIENQKAFLEDYAIRNGFVNVMHLADDGWSGTRWDRPGYLKMIEEVEHGNVATCIVKDMSRIGRDHLRVGLLLEQFRKCDVRFIAVNDDVDSDKGMDDFTPFRNILNEWVARDTSRKIRTIFSARTAQGKHVTGALPYGYLHNPKDRQKWILDEEAAPIVARIFQSVIDGKSMSKIMKELADDKILTPTAHWRKIGEHTSMGAPSVDPCNWSISTVAQILNKQEYMGWKVLNKTTKENYKSKRKATAPEDLLIFKDMHPAIVDEETWNLVHRLRETRRRPERIGGEPNPLTGVLYCADCGNKMYHKQGRTGVPDKPHHEYVCSSYRHYSRTCTCHYIRVPVIENLILTAIQSVSGYVREHEAEFLERVRETSVSNQEAAVKESRKKISKSKRRREEVSGLIKKLYEAYAAGKIPEKQFTELLTGYDTEQETLDTEISELQTAIDRYHTDSVRADKFIGLVKRHTEFPELSASLLNEFIEKVIVHEAVKRNGKREQTVDIYLNFIGKFELPLAEEPQEEASVPTRKYKLRSEMTQEQKEHKRELDKIRYAKKVAAKKAAEQAERAAIMQGTAYEVPAPESDIDNVAG